MSNDTGETGRTFVLVPVDMSTTSMTSLVVVIIGHSTDFSNIVQYVLSKIYRRLRLLVNSRDFQRDRKIDRWSS